MIESVVQNFVLGSLVGVVDGVGCAVGNSHMVARVVCIMPVFSLVGPVIMVFRVIVGLPAMVVAVVWLVVRVVILFVVVIRVVVGAMAVIVSVAISVAIPMVISMIIASMMVSIVMSMRVVAVGVSSRGMVVGLVMGWGMVYIRVVVIGPVVLMVRHYWVVSV